MVEILVGMGVFSLLMAGVVSVWVTLQSTALNVTSYAERQNDQMRVLDYLKRDIRRASNVEIYNGGTLVTGTASGSELRLTIPDYYDDAREEDDALGSKTPITPVLTSGAVTYGPATTVRYYGWNGSVVRNEAGVGRTIGSASGVFGLSFQKETTGEVRSRLTYAQALRGGGRTLGRQVEILCGQRFLLQP